MTSRVPRVLKYAGIAVGSLFLGLVLLVGFAHWYMSGGVFWIGRFDEKAWAAVPSKDTRSECYRGRMAADIKNRLLKSSMGHGDVERLLGKPDGRSSPGEYQYVLGMCSGLQIDYDVLHVHFDVNGKLASASIRQH
jgi:hypothetical protein